MPPSRSTTNSALRCRFKSIQLTRYVLRCPVQHIVTANQAQAGYDLLKAIRVLWWKLFALVTAVEADEAIFHVVIDLWRTALTKYRGQKLLIVDQHLHLLESEFPLHRLSSGFYMDQLWQVLRPPTCSSTERLDSLLRLESAADEFDSILFQSQTPLDQLAKVRGSFQRAISATVMNDANPDDLIDELQVVLKNLTASAKFEVIQPFFTEQFEAIYCARLLRSLTSTLQDPGVGQQSGSLLSLMARIPTKTMHLKKSDNKVSSILQGFMAVANGKAVPVEFFTSSLLGRVLGRLSQIDVVVLSEIELIQRELNVMGQELARSMPQLCRSPLLDLVEPFRVMYSSLTGLIAEMRNLELVPQDLMQEEEVMQRYLQQSSQGMSDDIYTISRAWIVLACTLLKLYVPNRPYDPALNRTVVRQIYIDNESELQSALSALQTFAMHFSGQTSSLRTKRVSQRLQDLGQIPLQAPVARPAISRMHELQSIFNSILQLCARFEDPAAVLENDEYNIVRSNLDRIISRLSNDFRAYDDIVLPLVGFLQCLSIGFALSRVSQKEMNRKEEKESSQYLHSLAQVKAGSTFEQHDQFLSVSLRQLDAIAIGSNITKLDTSLAQLALEKFNFLYQHWRLHLRDEQEKHAKNSSLYVFRGGQEDEDDIAEEEFQEIFPDYDGEVPIASSLPEISSAGDLAIKICSFHREIMTGSEENLKRLKPTILQDARSSKRAVDESCIIPTLLALHERVNYLDTSTVRSSKYNIYTDPNIHEAKVMVSAVRKIQRRFTEIQLAWPEHATLSEVLRIASEALAFQHGEPVAKFLTKIEKLQESIHEWQKVASLEFSAVEMYDELTKLIVSWRRLELSTWMTLLDLEADKAAQAAKNWWFVAYENLIAVPESLYADGESMQSHAEELLRTLESFMSSTPTGQFEARIALLSQFQSHLRLRSDVLSAFRVIHDAVANFIAYYSRFVPTTELYLAKQRQQLERNVKEVVQLASWKDTTIDALRQSAKTSHRKLFKVVRKFRTILARPVTSIIERGLPEVSQTLLPPRAWAFEMIPLKTNSRMIETCEQGFDDWSSVPLRFKNINSTTKLMLELVSSEASFDAAHYLTSFLTSLDATIAALQKATPATLTTDNKDAVKQLKTQKRVAFAETLKELRKMGLQHNISADVLAKQESTAAVFSSVTLNDCDIAGELAASAEYQFHKVLGLMPAARNVLHEHHDDLTPAEVVRSAGYLEALLQRSLEQKQFICDTSSDIARMKKVLERAEACSQHGNYVLTGKRDDTTSVKTLSNHISWLIPILELFTDAVTIQSSLGSLEASTVIESLTVWPSKLSTWLRNSRNLPEVPGSTSTDIHASTSEDGIHLINALKAEVLQWSENYPVFGPTLTELQPWIEMKMPYTNGRASADQHLDQFKDGLFAITDSVLASIQDLKSAMSSKITSSDETSWLVKEEFTMLKAMKSLRLSEIASILTSRLEVLGELPEDQIGVAVSLLTIILPVLQQYFAIATSAWQQLLSLHMATCKLSHHLSRSFIQIGTQGFCLPPEKSAEDGEKNEKMEEGTGLGDGQGAEDISKDIGADEDLTELAEEPNKDEKGDDIEDEKDAVDMADADMEGQLGEAPEKEDDEGSEGSQKDDEDDDMDEEVGEVDDLNPSAVDEKMWDDGESGEKDKEDDKGKGQKSDEQVAADQDKHQEEGQEEEGEEIEAGADEAENVTGEQPEKMDQYAQESEALDLPEDMDLEGNDLDKSDDESLDGLSDGAEAEAEEENQAPIDESGADDNHSVTQEDEVASETADNEEPEEDMETGDTAGSEVEEAGEREDELDDFTAGHEDNAEVAEDADQSENRGVGLEGEHDENEQSASANAAMHEHGNSSEDKKQQANGTEARESKPEGKQEGDGKADEEEKKTDDDAFKKLGDTLERWYRQQRQIQLPTEDETTEPVQDDVDMADVDFEHLPDNDTKGDTQALDTAAMEQAKALDDEMATDVNDKEVDKQAFDDEENSAQETYDEDIAMEDTEADAIPDEERLHEDGKNAFIGTQGATDRESNDMEGMNAESESDLSDVDMHLSAVHLESSAGTKLSKEAARHLWKHHETNTRTLASILTEHLRLILAPTLATKLRGDFRTGKRLNIKRIIPYIASSYKRDKIWMRRSVPSKRSYQIMVALDDSKSMAEGSASELAFETLALVAKSLAMLEAGELCVVGFGEDVRVAHSFEKPFTDEAGAEVFECFRFGSAED